MQRVQRRGGPGRHLEGAAGPFLIALAVILTRLAFYAQTPNAYEDAYIYFRHAENLAHGVIGYNPGERVLGVTSLPWLLWLTAGAWCHAPLVLWGRGLTLVLEVVAAFTFAAALVRWPARLAFLLLYAGLPYFSSLSASCLEPAAMVALALILATSPSGPLLCILASLRPEAALLTAPLAWGFRRWGWWLLGVGLPVLACVLVSGHPLPQSALAKAAIYGKPGLEAGWQWLTVWLPVYPENAPTDLLILAPLSGVFLMLAIVWVQGFKWSERSALVLGSAAVLVLYWLSGAQFFPWYLALPLIGVLIVVPEAVERLRLALVPLAVVAVLSFMPSWYRFRMRFKAEDERFGMITTELAKLAKPGQSVMLEPIGFIGYHCPQLRIIDEVGLIDPEMVAERKSGNGWYERALDKRKPDFLVLRNEMLSGGFAGLAKPFVSDSSGVHALRAYYPAFELQSHGGATSFWLMVRRKP